MMDDESLYRAVQSADESNQIGYARHLCERYLQDHPDDVATLIRYACNLISLSQYSAARTTLDRAEAIATRDRLPLVIARRGTLLEAQGELLGAEELFIRAHELDPEDASYLIYAGCVAFRRGDIGRAQALARQATRCADGCIDEAWFNLGGYLLSDKRYREAADCYRRTIAIDPDYSIARERLSDVELILKDVG